MFDKVLLIYEGMQIYFGPTLEAKQFFEDMGYVATPGQSTPDFLTSLTSPAERIVRHGFAAKVPQTASEFAQRWKASPAYTQLLADIDSYNRRHPQDGRAREQFAASRRGQQSRYTYVIMSNLKTITLMGRSVCVILTR
jgi:ATP-binding cassette subfamily G (WHITE) protein 2 (PDR)